MIIAFLAVLLTINMALRSLPLRRRGDGALTAVECAFLRGGTRAAVLAALAALHVSADGELDDPFERAVADAWDVSTGTRGIARRRPVRRAAVAVREYLVTEGLMAPTGHWAIARCALLAVPAVAALAVVDPRLDLGTVLGSAVGLALAAALWLAPRRTIAGWRALRAERRRYEQVTLADADEDALADAGAVGMLVALQGRPALEFVARQVSEVAADIPGGTTDAGPAHSPLTPRRLTL
jgi:uncharacterized protein (TIGR04222 family)